MGMHNIYENGLRFECKRCSYCCGHSPGFVYLSQKDVYLLSRHFNLSQKEFIEKYCRCANYYEGKQVVALKEEKTTTAHSGKTAVLLTKQDPFSAEHTPSGHG